ncbi:hypothetical protein Mp_4g05590 [Marchantia polymorpha subsp. ruderalis]|uniref:Uncharacterized protein n=2 Tax=Marchantia polymorpha TaxID=3197 RepID=A0AAF6B6P7_MARPO|nr:hypothetical protein MARPO_0087s0032 [Marchantia polymorpha]BBN07681.1 hypothetical protein Mp_4g05590 [Marchantia polymorpha subsp. ruderalis]|eukprot:PTQ33592.1 hypothetical protein MARPO_0087s0032 [Marchantia polymorpha]
MLRTRTDRQKKEPASGFIGRSAERDSAPGVKKRRRNDKGMYSRTDRGSGRQAGRQAGGQSASEFRLQRKKGQIGAIVQRPQAQTRASSVPRSLGGRGGPSSSAD